MEEFKEITLWIVGKDKEEALLNQPFDSIECAENYSNDSNNEGTRIWEIKAWLDLMEIREI